MGRDVTIKKMYSTMTRIWIYSYHDYVKNKKMYSKYIHSFWKILAMNMNIFWIHYDYILNTFSKNIINNLLKLITILRFTGNSADANHTKIFITDSYVIY